VKPGTPNSIADYRNTTGLPHPIAYVRVADVSAELGLDLKRVEVASRNSRNSGPVARAIDVQIADTASVPTKDARKNVASLGQFFEHGPTEHFIAVLLTRDSGGQMDQLLRGWNGQRTKQNGVEHAEYRSVCADTKGK
jgi:hypothetical protein